MELINVGLYGGKSIFGGRETPQRAEFIYCDRTEQCSYFRNNQCWNVTVPFGSYCKYGKISTVHGYTSRAKKYYEFDSKYRKHEKYHKLQHPPNKMGLIGDEVIFPYPHIEINITENEVKFEHLGFGKKLAYIPLNLFTIELINRICKFRPYAIMGGEIRDYQNETVPLFLAHLKEIMPDKYAQYAEKYGLAEKEINYIGRKAVLKTINPSDVFYKSSQYPQFNEKWHWDGEQLIYVDGYVSSFNITKDYKVAEIKLIPSDKSVVRISSNEQVNPDTIFID